MTTSSLLKDSQELTKTKGTIWKPLIAVSSLSIFSFISGQYLPYVIAAISGSGAIVAVPLAIFAVSTVVALISTIYLIRLAVSRTDNKKEEPQKFVCENCTNLENEPTEKEFDKSVKQDNKLQTEVEDKSNVSTPTPSQVTSGTQPNFSATPPPTPQSPSLTFGTAIPQNNNVPPLPPPIPTTQSPPVTSGTQPSPSVSASLPPPPPPPLPPGGLKNWNLSKSDTTGEKSSVGTTQNNTSYPKKTIPQKDGKQVPISNDAIINGRANLKKPQPNNSIDGQQGPVKGSDAVESNQCTDKKETLDARIEKEREERRKQNEQDLGIDLELNKKLQTKRKFIEGDELDGSDDEHDSSANFPIVNSISYNGEAASETTPYGSQNTGQSNSAAQVNISMVMFNKLARLYPETLNLQPEDEKGDEDHTPKWEDECSTTSILQSDHRERSESPDSGQGFGTTSPSHSVPKVDKPPESPKPKNKSAAAQVNNAAVNSKMKEPSTSSVNEQRKVKKLASFWENQRRI